MQDGDVRHGDDAKMMRDDQKSGHGYEFLSYEIRREWVCLCFFA